MYKSTPSAAWCKKRLLVTSLFAAIYQTSAIAADTSAVSGEAVDDTSEQMTVTAPAHAVQKAGSEHSISARELENKGANDFGSIMRYEPLISATGASGGSGNGKSGFDRGGYTRLQHSRYGEQPRRYRRGRYRATQRHWPRLRRPRRAQHLRHRPRLYRPVYVRQRGYPVRGHLDGNGQQRYRGECLLPPEIGG